MRIAPVSLLVLSIALPAPAADAPRIFVTDTNSVQVSADQQIGQSLVEANEGVSSLNLVIVSRFVELCPNVRGTGDPNKADYIVLVRRAGPRPYSPFVKGNHIAIFDPEEDLIYTTSASYVKKAVRNACGAL